MFPEIILPALSSCPANLTSLPRVVKRGIKSIIIGEKKMTGWTHRLRCWLCLSSALFSFLSLTTPASADSVKASKEPLVIPTYPPGEPERNPIFYFGRAYQGAKGPVYPYPFIDVLTDKRVAKTYNAVYLENDYVKICVLPEIGGRIFEAVDKTDGYNFFYRQHVIKPALVGMLGAWISGGVEWNIPHHHRATSFMPVDWTLADNCDGSKTIWVGETELRHRMKWLVGLTLRPGCSTLEVTSKIFNRTPLAHSLLCWANAAVQANENYQVIFPPSTTLATFHGKNQFSHWPVSREVYNRVDYTKGVDVSWWKNNPSPTSFFAFEAQEDFFAGYDHGQKAGVVFVADHHLVPGKKFWTWGTGGEGKRWEKILTDADGPYLELMFGSFSDNQPDYSWCQPYEVKTVTQYWFPVRALGGVKNATADAACNLELGPGPKAFLGLNTTSRQKAAKVLLTAGERAVFEEEIDIGPEQPFTAEIPLPPSTNEESLRLSLLTAEGKELLVYQPEKRIEPAIPQPVVPPPPPEKIKTNEELYLAGLRLEQFYNPALEPYPYYEEALKRDPGDARVNTALGRLYISRGLYHKAEAGLELAVARLTKNYTRPNDSEAFYYLGLALRAQGKEKEAFDAFARASWSQAWSAAASCQMAELASNKRYYSEALKLVDQSLLTNRRNVKALDLRTVLLRKTDRLEEAEKQACESLALDPLDFWSGNELALIYSTRGLEPEARKAQDGLREKMRESVQSYLELAIDYGNSGFWEESIDVLSRLGNSGHKPGSSNPMIDYFLGYYWHKKGEDQKAGQFCRKAAQMPADYVFPFRLESIAVLSWAEQQNPQDARAPYFLGNVLFDLQPEGAIGQWEKSRKTDDTLATVHRNLGLAYARVRNDLPAAVASLEKAVACDPNDPRLYFELDQLCDLANVTPEARLARLMKNHSVVVKRDDALSREISLLVELGHYERAISFLTFRHFHVWEGGGGIHDVYVDAHLLRGQKFLAGKKLKNALGDFQAALEYPDNLEVGQPASGGRSPEIYYFIGMAYTALGRPTEAKQAFAQSVASPQGPSELSYYQGMSWRKLGQEQKAVESFDGLIHFARENLEKSGSMDYFAKFGEKESAQRRKADFHYLLGLGFLGEGRRQEAKAEFQKALGLHPYYFRAHRQLVSLR
jgi:tetratricopeptide (TPR) repeat protein